MEGLIKMPTMSKARKSPPYNAASSTQQSSTPTYEQSERERALSAYMQEQITVDELLRVLDRQGSWIQRLIDRMSTHPDPVSRVAKHLLKRAD
jgi:hypothetical protein